MKEIKISAGSYDLNRFLEGGYENDIITMIVGPAGSGKTNFVLLSAVSQAKKGNKVIFMDTEGGFSLDRIKQLSGENFDSVLENILVLKPTKFEEQEKEFQNLLKLLKEKQIGLIVVDGMTMLYRLKLGEARESEQEIKNINNSLARQMRTLAEISRNKNIPVLVTNQVYSDFLSDEDFQSGKKRETHFVGGDLLKYWSKCIIELQSEKGRRKAILRKHRSIPEKELVFEITKEGVRKKGWI
ncbi:MAG: DNA repair and recombination protein RadB [Nanoarchaeota archaeon]